MADKTQTSTSPVVISPRSAPAKTYTQLLQEGIPNKGGLAQLASAETMADPPPSIAALARPLSQDTST